MNVNYVRMTKKNPDGSYSTNENYKDVLQKLGMYEDINTDCEFLRLYVKYANLLIGRIIEHNV